MLTQERIIANHYQHANVNYLAIWLHSISHLTIAAYSTCIPASFVEGNVCYVRCSLATDLNMRLNYYIGKYLMLVG